MKKVRHYKSVTNALSRNLYKTIYSEEYRAAHTGAWWLNSGYFPSRWMKATLEYDGFRDCWIISTHYC